MKNYVITIMDNEKSVEAAKRCILSGRAHKLEIEHFPASTPENTNLKKEYIKRGIPEEGFVEKYSRLENCMAAFLSHYRLWEIASKENIEVTVFEHDAYVLGPIPDPLFYHGCVNLGEPSYGKWLQPSWIGVGPLVSKPYFPGAHAYRLNKNGADLLINGIKNAKPTDVYLNKHWFPWLEEYHPWPVACKDSFTTIQKEAGCLAKHNWNENYEII